MQRLKFSILFFLLLPFTALAHIPTNISTPSLAPMLTKVTPAVVNVAVEKMVPPAKKLLADGRIGQAKKPEYLTGVGSGVIFNAKVGLIVTNAHVVDHAKIIVVTLKDGRRYRARLIGEDSGFDIAIIKIPAHNLKAIHFADSDNLKVGDFVVAIGSPFGLTQTVTSGVISALNRSEPRIEGFQSFIQTDAPINPGNSGGALINMRGQLIGINTAILTPVYGNIGIGFAIPSDMVHSILSQLLKYGKVKRGMLGVVAQNLSVELAQALDLKPTKGVIVTQVIPGSAAATAGVKDQDIIEKVNGKIIRSAAQLRNTLGLMRPGTKITLTILRDHKELTLSATVGNPKTLIAQHSIPFLSGLRLQNFKELEADGSLLQGALVTGVASTSPAALAGLLPGDIIMSANLHPVDSAQALKNIALQKPKQLVIKVKRKNRSAFLVVERQE